MIVKLNRIASQIKCFKVEKRWRAKPKLVSKELKLTPRKAFSENISNLKL